jgi:dihydrolipoamide dehydrogenase
MDRGFVLTDERLRTNLPNVYALGDIVPGLQLAHRGFQQGIFLAEQLAGLNPPVIDEAGIPRVTYCEPEVASVGLTEAQAAQRHGEIQTLTYDLAGNGKSQILQTQGAIKLVKAGAKGTEGPVVGIHMVGARVGELIGEAQLVYNWDAQAEDVAALVHAHPTQTEAFGEAHLALAGKPLHAHS